VVIGAAGHVDQDADVLDNRCPMCDTGGSADVGRDRSQVGCRDRFTSLVGHQRSEGRGQDLELF